MKAMLSQPMGGKTEKEILQTKEKAVVILAEKGYKLANTYFNFDDEQLLKNERVKNIPLYYLAKSLEEMSKCHAVYFCKGWENARGCKIEHETAKAYGLNMIYEKDWGDKYDTRNRIYMYRILWSASTSK